MYDWEKIKVGDIVYVEDWGKSFASNTTFFEKHLTEFKPEWVINYAYDNNMYSLFKNKVDTNKYRVLYTDKEVALITNYTEYYYDGYSRIRATYLISKYGLRLVNVRMTKKEIEEALGYSIEIIEEGE